MKLAITIWAGRIAPVFDAAGKAVIIDVSPEGSELSRSEVVLPETSPFEKVSFLAEAGVDHLICGAISWPAQEFALSSGIEVLGFIAGDVEQVLSGWLSNSLTAASFAMPGCSGRGGRRRRKGKAGRGFNQRRQDF
ncbi:NifB/NifX family molybdenum-iron cluster-binding protein [Sedimentisphaera salicampi]|uniref:NifB/NifX family molybdenum-iron cluster-binding protein n=1 Tax=Sedimentisphaera salicampi TaxID=1941349 RepID=UPI001379DE87|nr:NifB/NifX family molybdenum-iron cluster-binding protein [Sedimentisphaera salicampi]